MATATAFKTITCGELNELCQSGQSIDVIDVRTPVEFRELHCVYARNVPLDSLKPTAVMNGRGDDMKHPLYVMCRSGNRSSKACEAFLAAGFTNIVNVEGGTKAWEEGGYSVVRGRKAVSLERQVRIAAGSLVLLGATLGYFVEPYWIGLSAFVGAGLIFAGITDTCGMGMMLAKMPWNQVKTETKPTEANCDSGTSEKQSCCG
ncbi:DUF2892 domain-containing protein [bacterium]|nr:DUF2892 domain-containing protein [bacterium]